MATTVREARIWAVYDVLTNLPASFPITDHQIREIAELAVDALFTDHSMDHFTIRTEAEREVAEYLP